LYEEEEEEEEGGGGDKWRNLRPEQTSDYLIVIHCD
jgi:hypothetical protein